MRHPHAPPHGKCGQAVLRGDFAGRRQWDYYALHAWTGNNVPVVVMDWVDGKSLDTYIKERIHSKYTLATLAYNFCRMGSWLLSQPIAHGDLKPDNIIVRENGSLVLVDYDGMYVPESNGEFATEMGTPNFRHPMRDEFKFDEHIDDFSIAWQEAFLQQHQGC